MMPLPKVEMNVFETILARRSVRNYKVDKVDSGTIRNLLEAAIRAPTAMHQEPCGFIIIQDKQLLKDLSDRAKPLILAEMHLNASKNISHSLGIFDQPDFNIFYNAETLIIICGKTEAPLFEADCWLAAENLMLAACAMGLGSCVIGCSLSAFKSVEIKKQLHIPVEFTAVAPIVIGYPDEVAIPTSRKSPAIITSIKAN
ncbi:coenzyme F420:L-glutamate ligase [mine drainage metagenome]|uniref:Coenzyme F420:L-glutamate ligase n=1 Tax=mine drainage metagenome TaxID=410659 RepID=A0A1J5T9Q9_9ZZZZ